MAISSKSHPKKPFPRFKASQKTTTRPKMQKKPLKPTLSTAESPSNGISPEASILRLTRLARAAAEGAEIRKRKSGTARCRPRGKCRIRRMCRLWMSSRSSMRSSIASSRRRASASEGRLCKNRRRNSFRQLNKCLRKFLIAMRREKSKKKKMRMWFQS